MKIEVHSLKEELDKLFDSNKESRIFLNIVKVWPVASGAQLSAVTEIKLFKDNILFVSSTSSSAKTLLLMKKNEIIRNINKIYPDIMIKDIKILRSR